jgi:hypothetical protein
MVVMVMLGAILAVRSLLVRVPLPLRGGGADVGDVLLELVTLRRRTARVTLRHAREPVGEPTDGAEGQEDHERSTLDRMHVRLSPSKFLVRVTLAQAQ